MIKIFSIFATNYRQFLLNYLIDPKKPTLLALH